ncbi:acid phosphatase [Moniliophthora roreri MCA 2997]|uniref:Acid phosphatase n=2 Tax=Moniliophthora roreri TaxID=221103 RepID=V2Y9B9_MONRO|nr:acid phosphatase [Moniliophthora roreri MCA 2997]
MSDSHVLVETGRKGLLPTRFRKEQSHVPLQPSVLLSSSRITNRSCSTLRLIAAFFGGVLVCIWTQYTLCGQFCVPSSKFNNKQNLDLGNAVVFASPQAGSTEVHSFPPASPTNVFPSLFPSDVGYAGGTPTGAEAAIIATAPAYPLHTGAAQLVPPASLGRHGHKHDKFDLFRSWGTLSPWYSVGDGAFGIKSGPETPATCRVTGLHFLHRHGARYPSSWPEYGAPANLASRLHNVTDQWTTKGEMEFMNDWTYKLGEELLTTFGRQQLYDLGISMRLKYGFLLKNFTESNTIPVFRTESQDRMLHSALNFALGFFGYPIEGQYQQSITIEAKDFNNTLAPYTTCPNFNRAAGRGQWYVSRWADKYLASARKRLQKKIRGFKLKIEDVYAMQQLCAYETVAVGYSKFCELFTEDEWKGFDYALDLSFWYSSAFGSPVSRAQGAGWIQEMLHRLENRPVTRESNKFSMNFTLDGDPRTFPVDQSLYVDATHDAVMLNIVTALNLTSFAEDGPLPYDHIPKNRKFRVSQLAPFATNYQFQLLSCTSRDGPQIRIIINDGVAPLTGIEGCPKDKDGMCPVDTFIKAQKKMLDKVDWDWTCYGNWTDKIGQGPEWETVTGDPPKKDYS